MQPLTALSAHNFFHYFMLNTGDAHLSKNDRCKALALSILLFVVTAGLCHLFVRVVLYKKFQLPPTTALTDQVGTSKLGTGSARKALPSMFDEALVTRWLPQKSLKDCFEERNQKIKAEWAIFKNSDPNVIKQRWTDRLKSLSKNNVKEVKDLVASRYSYYSEALNSQFWTEEMENYCNNLGSKYSTRTIHIGCGGDQVQINEAWYRMLNLITIDCDVQHILDRPISKFLPSPQSKKFEWPPLTQLGFGSDRVMEEYLIIQNYFNERLDVLNREMSFTDILENRAAQEPVYFEEVIAKTPLNDLCKPLKKTNLRSLLASLFEERELTVADAQQMSKLERSALLERFRGRCWSQEKMTTDIDHLKLWQLRCLPQEDLEKILPDLPDHALEMIDNVGYLSVNALRSNFDRLFDPKTATLRLKSLTADQANGLLDLFDDKHFTELNKNTRKDLDVSKVRTHFEKLFPPSLGWPYYLAESYSKLTFELFDQLVDKFDVKRLDFIDFDILQKVDQKKWSPAQLACIQKMKANHLI